MKTISVGAVAAALIISLSVPSMAQGPSSPASVAMERLQKVMEQQSVSATVVMTVSSSKKAEKMGPMEFLMIMSKGKSRTEMDMAKMAAAAGGSAEGMPAGMDKMITIVRPDKKLIYQVMPGLSAYCEMPIPEAKGEKGEEAKITRKVQGSEKVEKYDCEKVLNTTTAADGTKTEMMTWEAKELKGLPIKMETTTPEGKMTMVFKNIDTKTPAASLFEPPADAKKYASMQEMMMSGMMKMMQGE